jgi:Uridylate kinase
MAKNNIDGVYDADPRKNKDAKRVEHITFDDMLAKQLKVMDPAAVSICQQENIPIIVFDFAQPGSIERIVLGEKLAR